LENNAWRRWAAGVAPGLQIQCSGLSPRWVGSIPIRLRQGFQGFKQLFELLLCAGKAAQWKTLTPWWLTASREPLFWLPGWRKCRASPLTHVASYSRKTVDQPGLDLAS
jgi:hypothetical protein